MKRALLAGRADARDTGPRHCGVELVDDLGGAEVAAARTAREDEDVVARVAELAPPAAEELDDVGREVDVAALVVLRRAEVAVGDAAADADHGAGEVCIGPGEREQLALAHAGLERAKEERTVDARLELREEARQLLVLEIGGFLALGARALCLRELLDRIAGGVAVRDRG